MLILYEVFLMWKCWPKYGYFFQHVLKKLPEQRADKLDVSLLGPDNKVLSKCAEDSSDSWNLQWWSEVVYLLQVPGCISGFCLTPDYSIACWDL